MPPATMQTILIPGTRLRTSKFIFGTASLFNVGSQARRIELLDAAVQAGFTHFDTAPYYGFGWAERDLGELIRRHPKITVTTKVGIYSPGGEASSRASVLLRKSLGRMIPMVSRPTIDFSLERAQTALENSLRRLQTDHVSLYMLHDPAIEIVATHEWQRWLDSEVRRGRIGAYGLALTSDRLIPFLDEAPELANVIQLLDSLESKEADCLTERGRPLQITYGYVSAMQAERNPAMSPRDVLRAAAQRNKGGAIIVSTTKLGRLGQYAELLTAKQ